MQLNRNENENESESAEELELDAEAENEPESDGGGEEADEAGEDETLEKQKRLFWAAGHGNADGVKEALLDNPSWGKITLGEVNGWTALAGAAFCGHAECVKALIPFSDVNRGVGSNGATALRLAAEKGRLNCVRLLLPASDANAFDKEGRANALMAALAGAHLDCVAELLPRTDLRAVDNRGKTALDQAIGFKNWECADLLAASLGQESAKKLRESAPAQIELPRCQALAEQRALEAELRQDQAERRAAEEESPASSAANTAARRARRV